MLHKQARQEGAREEDKAERQVAGSAQEWVEGGGGAEEEGEGGGQVVWVECNEEVWVELESGGYAGKRQANE